MRLVSLPTLTHLQFAILAQIESGTQSGKAIRDGLKANGVKLSGPAFYQAMSRLEASNLVDGNYTQKIIAGQIIKERIYRIKTAGSLAVKATREFYQRTV